MRKLISIFFLLVFCFSITGFSAELHFCSGEISDISFIGTSSCENCETDHSHCEMHMEKKDCCDTTVIVHQSVIDFLHSNFSVQIAPEIDFIAVQFFYQTNLFVFDLEGNSPVDSYLPPDIEKDISVLFQSILI